jgi:hypothetical protein
MEGEGGLIMTAGGVGGYECILELLARSGPGMSLAWIGPVMFVREVKDRAAST